jgi:regulator of cell morphogenesis and NO signaling
VAAARRSPTPAPSAGSTRTPSAPCSTRSPPPTKPAAASIDELCDHIVDEHHRPLHPRLERISELLGKVVRAHGADDPSVARLQRRFEDARTELVEHMRVEEQDLFPACRELDGGNGAPGLDRDLLPQLEDDHGGTGAALAEIRELAGDYRPERAHCNTHRVLLHELAELELELHRHIHEENNVLFPKVRERLAAAG